MRFRLPAFCLFLSLSAALAEATTQISGIHTCMQGFGATPAELNLLLKTPAPAIEPTLAQLHPETYRKLLTLHSQHRSIGDQQSLHEFIGNQPVTLRALLDKYAQDRNEIAFGLHALAGEHREGSMVSLVLEQSALAFELTAEAAEFAPRSKKGPWMRFLESYRQAGDQLFSFHDQRHFEILLHAELFFEKGEWAELLFAFRLPQLKSTKVRVDDLAGASRLSEEQRGHEIDVIFANNGVESWGEIKHLNEPFSSEHRRADKVIEQALNILHVQKILRPHARTYLILINGLTGEMSQRLRGLGIHTLGPISD